MALFPALMAAALIVLASCDFPGGESPQKKEWLPESLTVLTRNAPTTLYEGPLRREGFEHDLAMEFARHMKVPVRFKIYSTIADTMEALEKGEGDFAAAGIPRMEGSEGRFLFGPDYQGVEQQLVCRRGGNQPKDLVDLPKVRIMVPVNSPQEDRLKSLQKLLPTLTWESDLELSSEQLLEKVWREEVDCTVADSNIVALNRRYFPELSVVFPVSETQPLVWMLPMGAVQLQRELGAWFQQLKNSGRLEELYERYYGHVDYDEFDFVDNRKFIQRIQGRLPRFKATFQEAEEKYGTSWRLLAAQAYQESHWNPLAESPTGVRGIMMLTRATAHSMGISNRLDVRKSIMGGAWYLADLKRRLPEEIVEPDRTWFALAAYNVGLGHIWDARDLTRKFDKNPDLWKDLQTILPLLSRKQYYQELRYGYARGTEPVRYVQRIRDYYDILVRWEGDNSPAIIPGLEDDPLPEGDGKDLPDEEIGPVPAPDDEPPPVENRVERGAPEVPSTVSPSPSPPS